MKMIPLTRGQFAMVDDDDFDALAQHKWYAYKNKKSVNYYAARDVRVGGKKKCIWMHREVNGTPEGLLTDHIDGNTLNDRRSNLRNATHQENMINCGRHISGTSKYRGVSWHRSNGCWIAQITVNSKNNWIGSFKTEEEARIAYEAKRAEVRAGQVIRKDAA